MDESRVEQLLRQYAAHVPAERLFADERATRIWAAILATPEATDGVDEAMAAPTEPAPSRLPFRLTKMLSRRRLIVGVAAVIALGAVVVGLRGWNARTPRLDVDGAYAKSELFRTTRAAGAPQSAPGNTFYIGVRMDRPAYLHIFAVDDQSRVEPLALDRAGTHELHIPAQSEIALGGYALASADRTGASSRIVHFVILATTHSVDEAAVARWLEAANRSDAAAPRVDLQQLTDGLRRSLGGTVSVVTP